MLNRNQVILLLQLQKGLKIVEVKFMVPTYPDKYRDADAIAGKSYYYKAATVPDVAINDTVVVQARESVGLAKVCQVFDRFNMTPQLLDMDKAMRHVICKVDTQPVFVLEQEERMIGDQLAAVEIQRQMDEIRRQSGIDFSAMQTPALNNMLAIPQAATPIPPGYYWSDADSTFITQAGEVLERSDSFYLTWYTQRNLFPHWPNQK